MVVATEAVRVLDAQNITVEVDGGRITLKGTVRSWPEKRRSGKTDVVGARRHVGR